MFDEGYLQSVNIFVSLGASIVVLMVISKKESKSEFTYS